MEHIQGSLLKEMKFKTSILVLVFIKNQIKNLVCKRKILGDVNEWHPEINMRIN